nr:2TM domain-containing protein [uncultured Flavobacterium sp.]
MELNKPNNSEFEEYQKAKKQVEELKGFYLHLTFFVLAMALLIIINLVYSPHYLWFLWTFCTWGIAVIFHALLIFNWIPFFGKNWENQKLAKYLQQEKKKINTNTYE